MRDGQNERRFRRERERVREEEEKKILSKHEAIFRREISLSPRRRLRRHCTHAHAYKSYYTCANTQRFFPPLDYRRRLFFAFSHHVPRAFTRRAARTEAAERLFPRPHSFTDAFAVALRFFLHRFPFRFRRVRPTASVPE